MNLIKLEDGRIINNHYDKDGKYIKHGEINSGEKMTIQNEAYTIRELLEKFTTGVLSRDMLKRSGIEYEYDESVMMSFEPEPYVDRTDIEEHASMINSKISAAKKAKEKATTTTSEAKEAKEAKTEAKKADENTNNT